jgi:hypothetical protein
MKKELNQTDTPWSLRTRQSLVEEDHLQGDLGKIGDLIGWTERKIAGLEKEKRHALGLVATVRGVDQIYLSNLLADLEDKGRKLAAYKEQRAFIENAITQLAPSPGALEVRAKGQQQCAQLVAERAEKDARLNDLVSSLRKALQERAILTARMNESVATLGFTSGDDLLDTRRFDELLASLPSDPLVKSEQWVAWFLGKEKAVKVYIARDRLLVIPETLASHGVYRFGDHIELPEDRARELMRKDRPAATQAAPWRCAPPSIMTVEAWEATTVVAEKLGIAVLEVVLWEDWQRDAKQREGFIDTGVGVVLTDDHGEAVTVKVRAKRKIHFGGQEYGIGDVFEFRAPRWDACAMFQEGAIARP